MPTRRTALAAGLGLPLCLTGCAGGDPASTDPEPGRAPEADLPPGPYWYTHPQPTGNRTLDGAADLRNADPVRIAVDGRPRWLVAHPAPRGSYWTVVAADGSVSRWQVADGTVIGGDRLDSRAADGPPVVASGGGAPCLLEAPSAMGPRAGQVVTPPSGDRERPRRLFAARNGDLVVDGAKRSRFAVDAPPDVRPAAVGDGRYAVYGDATDRYDHGALSDRIEPSSLVVVDAMEPELVARTVLDSPAVFEGLQPLAADLDGDGEPELVTTVADAADGARIAVYSPTGERVATGPVHGPGWRHQLAVAGLGPDGAHELAVVLKPHVTRTLEYYRLEGGELTVRATADGFATHEYGSRNIDGAVAADLDDDGTAEMLLPTVDRRRLAGVGRTLGGARTRWQWELGAELRSNVTGVRLAGGGVAVGAATVDEVLVWSA
jgi:hypothetical protein